MHRSDSNTIAKLAQTGRSSTLAAKPDRDSTLKRSHLSLHGHKHHSHHHHRHGSRSAKYGADDKEIKSAVLPAPRSQFPDINVVRSANSADTRSNPTGSASSANDSKDLVSPSVISDYDRNARHLSSRVVKPEDVARERARQKQREGQLRNALRVLDEQSMATTRRLDDTYYSILEKVAGLHGTIGGLQELSTMTQRLRAEFAADADDLVDEVDGSLDAIGDFDAQARLLEEFEARIVAGKEKAARLNERLDAARKRVDEREKLDEEWRASVNRRLRIFWSVLAALVALFLVGYIVYGIRTQGTAASRAATNGTTKHNFSIDLENVVVPPPVREILEEVHSSSQSATTTQPPTSDAASDDERLHVFDELPSHESASAEPQGHISSRNNLLLIGSAVLLRHPSFGIPGDATALLLFLGWRLSGIGNRIRRLWRAIHPSPLLPCSLDPHGKELRGEFYSGVERGLRKSHCALAQGQFGDLDEEAVLRGKGAPALASIEILVLEAALPEDRAVIFGLQQEA
ncbi:uncharacterized protein BKCO1_8500016 [Diplodia corticola]|uniref:Uncharacterized protein n=1 Tax=Diplodia corticola TaxID=236234 RepID=A0A1J9QK87_9PEZI|nr:uncharacterized protein BKCO1_8500016 [Diplodia corticola]OJD29278.1 hypothetical protein BKCO1_8500016 [Diplodia corticola]